jgi:hypothetical protein
MFRGATPRAGEPQGGRLLWQEALLFEPRLPRYNDFVGQRERVVYALGAQYLPRVEGWPRPERRRIRRRRGAGLTTD